ncbi:MAG: flagellar export protein FliJ [Steroidobacteraceae bacterium]
MRRTQRMQTVTKALAGQEQEHRRALHEKEQALDAARQRLDELLGYLKSYREQFVKRFGEGTNGAVGRGYQQFVERLQSAIAQQNENIRRASGERDKAQHLWREAARRSKSVERVASRWAVQSRKRDAVRDQKATDDLVTNRTQRLKNGS